MRDKPSMSYNSRKFRMIKGKSDDYRLFVRMHEKYGGLPGKIFDHLNKYPFCGAVKLKALKLRFGEVEVIDKYSYKTVTYEEYKSTSMRIL